MNALPSPSSALDRRKALLFGFAKVAVSVGLIVWIAAGIDIGAILARLIAVPLAPLVVAGLLEILALALAAWRWQMVLAALDVGAPYLVTARLYCTGQFINQILPTNIGGDIYRAWWVFADGGKLLRALMSVALDRVVALVGLAVLAAPGIFVLLGTPEAMAPAYGLIVLVAGVVLGLALFLACGAAGPQSLTCLAPRLKPAFAQVIQASRLAHAVFLVPRLAAPAIGLAVAGHGLAVAAILVLAKGLGINLGIGAAFALIPLVILSAVIPISHGGWGMREGAMAIFLSYAGVAAEAAVSLSLLFGGVNLLVALLGGAWGLMVAARPAAMRR